MKTAAQAKKDRQVSYGRMSDEVLMRSIAGNQAVIDAHQAVLDELNAELKRRKPNAD